MAIKCFLIMINYVKEAKVFGGIHRFIIHISTLFFVLFVTIESTYSQNTQSIYDSQNLDKNSLDGTISFKKLYSYLSGILDLRNLQDYFLQQKIGFSAFFCN